MAVNPFAIIALIALAGVALSRTNGDEGEDGGDGEGEGGGGGVGGDCGSQTPGYLQWPRLDGWGVDPSDPPVINMAKGDKVHVNLFGSTGTKVKFSEVSISAVTSPQGRLVPGPLIEIDYWHGEPCPPEQTETPGILYITANEAGSSTVSIPGTDGSMHIANINVTAPVV